MKEIDELVYHNGELDDQIKHLENVHLVTGQVEEQKSPQTELRSGQYSYWEDGRKLTKTI